MGDLAAKHLSRSDSRVASTSVQGSRREPRKSTSRGTGYRASFVDDTASYSRKEILERDERRLDIPVQVAESPRTPPSTPPTSSRLSHRRARRYQWKRHKAWHSHQRFWKLQTSREGGWIPRQFFARKCLWTGRGRDGRSR